MGFVIRLGTRDLLVATFAERHDDWP